MSRVITGTKTNQIFSFVTQSVVRVFRTDEQQKSNKKKKIVYIPKNNQWSRIWSQK